MKLKKIAILVLAVLALALVPGTAQAQGVDLTYSLNFSSFQYYFSTWNRLDVTVANNNQEDLQGVVTVRIDGAYNQEVYVEAGKSASLVFYLPPQSLEGSLSGSNGTITVTDSRGKELKSVKFYVSNNPRANYIGVLGGELQGFKELASFSHGSQLVGIKPEHLDNLPFAENFSIIVINDPQPVMISSQQKENLRRWVELGGILVLGGGSGWQRTLDLVPADLAPIKPQGLGTVTAEDLEELALPVPIPQQKYTVAVAESLGKVLRRAGEIPLLVQSDFGQGVVLWSALDLTAAPLEDEANSFAFWRRLALPQLGTTRREPSKYSSWGNAVFNSISQGQVASTLSPLKIFLVLLAYILLAGPINWLILRKLDRREWAWLTIPVLAVLFTTGTFVAGRMGRGGQQVLYQLNLIHVQSENMAKVDSRCGVFVPDRRGVSISLQAAALAPMDDGDVTLTGDGAVLRFDHPPMWSVQRFFATDYMEIPGKVSVEAEMKGFKTGSLDVEITNDGQPFFDSYIRLGNFWYQIGPLDAGEHKAVTAANLSWLDFGNILQRYSSYAHAPWIDINELLPTAPVLFLGFGDAGALSVPEMEAVVALDIWVQPLSLGNFVFDGETFDIPPRFIKPEVLPGLGVSFDQWDNRFEFYGQGSFNLVFSLPENLDLSQGEYFLNVHGFWGDAKGIMEVYNHRLGEWQELSSLNALSAVSRTFKLEDPGALVENGRLLVRVSYEEGHVSFSNEEMDITVEGGRFND